MGMRENWSLFVESTKAKGESHERVAQHWDKVHNVLNFLLIFLSAITTILAALDGIPELVILISSGVTTLVFLLYFIEQNHFMVTPNTDSRTCKNTIVFHHQIWK